MSGNFITKGLLPSLAELERILTEEASTPAGLARLADPAGLDVLFRFHLATLLRRGPDGVTFTPRDLLAEACRASAAGVLPASAPAGLRRTLHRLESLLHEAGAWDAAQPAWWSPLPLRSPFEELWESFGRDGDALSLPPPAEIAEAIGDPGTSPQWLSLPAFLQPSLTRTLHAELEAAGGAGLLDLERGGVGAAGEHSVRRSDRVCYVSGLEPELLEAAPTLAAFVQWGLGRLAPQLSAGGRPVHPPRSAMLARYPAPSGGYAPHMDNPGGEHDNGRTLTLVVYLNAPGKECAGGEIAVWAKGGSTAEAPAAVLAPRSGSAVLFDSRAIAHQVRPLDKGPDRWALTFWLSDRAQRTEPLLPEPRLGLTELLLPIASPPLPARKVIFHELGGEKPAGEIVVRDAGESRPRVGIVCTAYREGERLDRWCEHHFELGVDHLVVVFDHLEEAPERAVAERLRSRHPEERLTIWSGAAASERWPALADQRLDELRRFAGLAAASYAISSRQALNASVALEAARTGELGGAPLDWLLHLDADELFHLEGSGRGGATLEEHFSAATEAGYGLLRYVNHELLLPRREGSPPRFKVNPRLAAARLGPGGWRAISEHLGLAQTDPRPWFNGYFNGKSAVRVRAGAAAAGVHGWYLEKAEEWRQGFLAGPSVLHLHFSTPEAFRRKYLAIAASPIPPGQGLFELSPSEEATVGLIRRLEREGADSEVVSLRLEELHGTMTSFSEEDVDLLEEAGLILGPIY